MVFEAVRTHFPRKITACLVDGTAINKQPLKFNNEYNLSYSGRLVEWLERSPSNRAAGVRIQEGGRFFIILFLSFLSFYCMGNYFKTLKHK